MMHFSHPSKELTESLSEEALKVRLRSAEHDFVERKSKSNEGGWLRTAVAFANSTPVGYPAVLYVAVDDQCNAQVKAVDGRLLTELLEDLAKSVTARIGQAYPPDLQAYRSSPFSRRCRLPRGCDSRQCNPAALRGRVLCSPRPETKRASSAQFDALIAERNSVVYMLRQSD